MVSGADKGKFHRDFDTHLPSGVEEADSYLEFDSARVFSKAESGDIVFRLALTSDETLDLATNAVCAGRFAAALLEILSRSGDFVVDLAVYEPRSGAQLARVKPTYEGK